MRAYLSLGSNLGHRAAQLAEAVRRLAAAGLSPAAVSAVYETEPQGRRDQAWFLNCVLAVDTVLPATAILEAALAIERAMGRRRQQRWEPRVIDIDVLLHGSERIVTPQLVVPHPRLAERAFALVPLAELAPDLEIPGIGPVGPLAARRRAEPGQGLRLWGPLRLGAGVRDLILERLRVAAPGAVSGAALAAELGISRAAVWKHVQRLRAAGHPIAGASGAGYRWAEEGLDLLPLAAAALQDPARHMVGHVLHVLRSVESTNAVVRTMGLQGSPAGTAVVAEEQTAGRGRAGRGFLSPRGGVYLSVLLRPALAPAQGGRLTLLAALAVCEALEELGCPTPSIKWPNDVLLSGGKVCGILLEMVAREDCVDFVVLGAGLNVHTVPPGVGATSLWGAGVRCTRAEVARAVLTRLDADYLALEAGRWQELLDAWRRRCQTLGREVRVHCTGGAELIGRAVDVSTEGALRVDTGGGVQDVYAGDVVHLRPADTDAAR